MAPTPPTPAPSLAPTLPPTASFLDPVGPAADAFAAAFLVFAIVYCLGTVMRICAPGVFVGDEGKPLLAKQSWFITVRDWGLFGFRFSMGLLFVIMWVLVAVSLANHGGIPSPSSSVNGNVLVSAFSMAVIGTGLAFLTVVGEQMSN